MNRRYTGAREAPAVPAPQRREPIRIGFIGGPLQGRTGTTRNLTKHRDADGLAVPYDHAINLIRASRQLDGTMPGLYALARDHRSYEWLPALDTEVRTHRIKVLLDSAKEHPEFVHEYDKKIRAIEAGAL